MHYTTRSIFQGAFVVAIAYFIYAMMLTLGRIAAPQVGPAVVILFQMGVSTIILLPTLLREGKPLFVTRHPFRHLFRDIAGLLSYAIFYTALAHISLTEATLMNNTAPLFVPFIGLAILGERISKKAWLGIILGFIGMAIVINPEFGGFDPWVLFAAGSGLAMAAAVTATKLLAFTERAYTVVFYYSLVSTIAIAPFAIAQWQTPTGLMWPILIAIGFLFVFTQLLQIFGYRRGPVALLSPLTYLTVLFTGLFDWIIWDRTLTPIDYLGAALIIFGGAYTVIAGRKGWRVTG